MHGNDVTLKQASMKFGEFTAVHSTDLEIRAGEFFSILGPSGCGKTTLLRLISGFLDPTTGTVSIGDIVMNGTGPSNRPTALIFQNLALFPLMSVWENVAFGLEARGMGKKQRQRKADELLELVELRDQGDKKPGELSGGQRQRVAIARALAVEPSVLLLDEPLSALDLKLRQHMRAELKAIHRKTGITFIYITHDQGEALTMSDRIAVMNEGRLLQTTSTEDLYERPTTPFVATFVGENNVLRGKVAQAANGHVQVETEIGLMRGVNGDGLKTGDSAMIFVRPERIDFASQFPPDHECNRLTAKVDRYDLEGPFMNVFMRVGEQPIMMHLSNKRLLKDMLSEQAEVVFSHADTLALKAGDLARD